TSRACREPLWSGRLKARSRAEERAMQWKVHGERPIYTSKWVTLWLVDVELPDGQRFEHHVVRMQTVAAAAVIADQRRVLMLWRHRFITGTWGWEIPTGIVDPNETPAQTATREVEEETGWRAGPRTPRGASGAPHGGHD